ncbi:MAG: hypothetical protein HY903_12710 [Deltaproteobacteria bacterium]|nr:hypothetical protein [Deltaproteobacteria bacterium]
MNPIVVTALLFSQLEPPPSEPAPPAAAPAPEATATPAPSPPPAASTPKSKLAVLGINADDPSLSATYLDVLVTGLAKTGIFEVISKNEINAILGLEKAKDMVGCDQASCMAEIGGALGVDRIVSGSVSKVGDGFVVNLQLINSTYGNVENRVSMQWDGREAQVIQVIAAAAESLVLPMRDKKPGTLEVTQTPAAARIFVDNKPAGAKVAGLEIGPHVLKVAADGFQEKTIRFVVTSGAEVSLDGSLKVVEEKPLDVKRFGVGLELEVQRLLDAFGSDTNRAGPVQMLGFSLEASYRFSQWVRVGGRAFASPQDGSPIYFNRPWPSRELSYGAFNAGAFVASSPLYRENVYDICGEFGLDLHRSMLEIIHYTLPDTFDVNRKGEDARWLLGFHIGALADYHISPAFTLGLGARYYWVPGYTTEFNGKTEHRSESAVSLSPRMTVRF